MYVVNWCGCCGLLLFWVCMVVKVFIGRFGLSGSFCVCCVLSSMIGMCLILWVGCNWCGCCLIVSVVCLCLLCIVLVVLWLCMCLCSGCMWVMLWVCCLLCWLV